MTTQETDKFRAISRELQEMEPNTMTIINGHNVCKRDHNEYAIDYFGDDRYVDLGVAEQQCSQEWE